MPCWPPRSPRPRLTDSIFLIYSHPLGYHGYAAGAAIGFWDNQHADETRRISDSCQYAWSIELTTYPPVPEWGGQRVEFRLEEDAYSDGTKVNFMDGRETDFTLIPADGGFF